MARAHRAHPRRRGVLVRRLLRRRAPGAQRSRHLLLGDGRRSSLRWDDYPGPAGGGRGLEHDGRSPPRADPAARVQGSHAGRGAEPRRRAAPPDAGPPRYGRRRPRLPGRRGRRAPDAGDLPLVGHPRGRPAPPLRSGGTHLRHPRRLGLPRHDPPASSRARPDVRIRPRARRGEAHRTETRHALRGHPRRAARRAPAAAERRGAVGVLLAAVLRGRRDDAQRDRRSHARLPRLARAARTVAGGRPPHGDGRRGDPALDDPLTVEAPHGHRAVSARRPGDRARTEGSGVGGLGQSRRRALQRSRRRSASGATPTRISPSATASISAWAHTWRASSSVSHSKGSWARSTGTSSRGLSSGPAATATRASATCPCASGGPPSDQRATGNGR